jgi:hypothetical protein
MRRAKIWYEKKQENYIWFNMYPPELIFKLSREKEGRKGDR